MSDSTTPTAALVARIRKLLALAGNNPNENEAAAAAAKAQELMADYNLELTTLGDAETTVDTARERRETDLKALHDWQRDLMTAVAQNHFCLAWRENVLWTHTNGKSYRQWRHRVIGRAINVEACLRVYTYLVDTMQRLNPYDTLTISARSWNEGCVERLAVRMAETRKAQETAQPAKSAAGTGGGNAVVLADVYSSEHDLNTDLRMGREPGTTARLRAEQAARDAARQIEWEARRAEQAARLARLKEEFPEEPADVLIFVSSGWSWDAARAEYARQRAALSPPKPETEAQRLKREARERASERRWQSRSQREARKVDFAARYAGRAAGGEIGLDAQVRAEARAKLTK